MVTYPIQWEFLKRLHKKSPQPPILRNEQIEQQYVEYKKKQGNLMIKKLLLRFNIQYDYFKCPSWFSLVPCDFPYNLSYGIDHWILWLNPKYKSCNYNYKDIDHIIRYYLDNYCQLSKYHEYIYFDNLVQNQSVKEIVHYHVFFH